MIWIACESYEDLEEDASNADAVLLDAMRTRDADSWGYIRAEGNGTQYFVPIEYCSSNPLSPEAREHKTVLLIGIFDLLAGYDIRDGRRLFCHTMPWIFHEFVRFEDERFIARDEIAFVCLSYDGDELWTADICDVIESYVVEDNCIRGRTLEGKDFSLEI